MVVLHYHNCAWSFNKTHIHVYSTYSSIYILPKWHYGMNVDEICEIISVCQCLFINGKHSDYTLFIEVRPEYYTMFKLNGCIFGLNDVETTLQ